MIGRGLWFAAGAAAGIYGSIKARRVAEEFTAEGVRHRMKAASLGARLFREEVAQGQTEAAVELRERYEVAAGRLDTPGGSSLELHEGDTTSKYSQEDND